MLNLFCSVSQTSDREWGSRIFRNLSKLLRHKSKILLKHPTKQLPDRGITPTAERLCYNSQLQSLRSIITRCLIRQRFQKSLRASKSMKARRVAAPRGSEISCKGWHQEAALRMLM